MADVSPPPGFTLDASSSQVTPPAGFTLDQPAPSQTDQPPQAPSALKQIGEGIADIPRAVGAAAQAVIPKILTPAEHQAQAARTKELLSNGDYLQAAKELVTNAVEQTPGGRLITGAISSAADQYQKAKDAMNRGEHIPALLHAVAMLPIPGAAQGVDTALGSEAKYDKYGNVTQNAVAPQPYRAATQAATLGAGALLPKVIPKGASVPVTPKAALTPEEASAVSYADSRSTPVPLTAGQRTGNATLLRNEAAVASAPGGAEVAAGLKAKQSAALQQAAAELPPRISPAAATPESAGAGTGQALADLSQTQGAGASSAYAQLEKIEADPSNLQTVRTGTKSVPTGVLDSKGNPIASEQAVTKDVALPVDMRAAKIALQPVFDRLKQEMPLAQQQSSRGLQAIQNVLGQDDFVPASVADQNLSALKQLQREAVHPKTQFLANQAVNAVSPAVTAAVAKAGPEALDALNQGRALTKAKYATDATMDRLQTEPVKLFNQLTAGKDTQIDLLRDVQSKTPDALPAVGRAYIEGALESGKPAAGWAKLGPETKKILFPDPALRQNLNDHFTLLEKTGAMGGGAANPAIPYLIKHPLNPAAYGYVLHNYAAAKMMMSPGGARLLSSGLRVPAAPLGGAAKAVVASKILNLAGSGAKPLNPSLPMAARNQQPAQPALSPQAANTAKLPKPSDVVAAAEASARAVAGRLGLAQ